MITRYVFTALVIFASLARFSADAAAETPQQRARQCIDTLQTWYQPEQGVWKTTSWWNAANALTAIVDYIRLTGDQRYLGVVENSFIRCKEFTVDDDPNNIWVCRDFINAWYDDEGWWVLLWLDVYDLTKNPKYLAMAKTTFADMTQGWDDVCGGGVYWKKPNIGKHTITNALFMLGALRLHQRSPGEVNGRSYKQWALDTWSWLQEKSMVNGRHLIENGLSDACELQAGEFFTYNQGVMIGALVELANVTREPKYLDQAERMAIAATSTLVDSDGILREHHEPDLTGDSAQFKGVLMRHLKALYAARPNPIIRASIIKNADSLWQNARNVETGEIGGLWYGPLDVADAARQSSALDALNAAMAVELAHE